MSRSLSQDPTNRYARKLGVQVRVIRRMGGRERLKTMQPWARKILLQRMFITIKNRRKP